MLSCIRSISVRSLALVGLVVLMVLVADSVWAQYLVSSASQVPGTFPYLSPDITQRNLLINAFAFQMAMFGAISGGGNLAALNYFALTGFLVGALMAIFNPKYRKAAILAPWLLVVVITVFAPYGSKLLFYPVAKEAVSGGILGDGQAAVTDCIGDNAKRCGFTPQLAAIHVASTLQLMFSDVFRSMQWDGLMQRVESEANLDKAKELVLTDDYKNVHLPNYKAACNTTGYDTLITAYTGKEGTASTPAPAPTNTSAPVKNAPTTAGQMMQDYDTFYKGNMSNSSPPPAMVLYGNDEFKKAITDNGWDANVVTSAYEQGLQAIYKGVGAPEAMPIRIGCADSSCITADKALEAINQTNFFSVSDGFDTIMPGFLFTWSGAKNFAATGNRESTDISIGESRQCYVPKRRDSSDGVSYGAVSTLCNTISSAAANTKVDTQKFSYLNLRKQPYGSVNNVWQAVHPLLSNGAGIDGVEGTSPIWNMPVGMLPFGPVKVAADLQTSAPEAGEVTSGVDCIRDGKKLIDGMIETTFGPNGKASDYSNLGKILKGETSLDTNTLSRADITDIDEEMGETRKYAGLNKRVNDLQVVFNGRLIEASSAGNITDSKDRQALLLTIFFDKVWNSTQAADGINTQKSTPDEISASSKTTDVVGSTGLTWLGGGIAKFLGTWIGNIGSAFIGPFSQALIYFLSILIDIAMLALIVLTPFLFLAGLFVPTMAVGVLSVVVMGAFILKFVPVTLIILNNLGMMIYRFIGFSDHDESYVMQSMIIIAMAGLYANLVGMTFFLLFKLGDPAAILGRFTALDGAAKQLADQGMAATLTALAAATTLATGGVMAGAGHFSLKAGARKALNKLGVPDGMIDGAQSVMGAGAKGVQEESTALSTVPTDAKTPEQLAHEAEAAFDADPDRFDLMDQMDGKKDAQGNPLFDEKDKDFFRSNGYVVDKNGTRWTANNSVLSSDSITNDMLSAANSASSQSRFGKDSLGPLGETLEGGNAKQVAASETSATANADAEAQASIEGREGAPAIPVDEVPGAKGTGVEGNKVEPEATAPGTLTQGTAPIQVSVVDGKLSTVGEVGNIQALAEGMNVQAKAAGLKEDAVAKEVADTQAAISLAKKDATGDKLTALNAAETKLNGVTDETSLNEFNRSQENRAIRPILLGAKGSDEYKRNMNDQLASEINRANAEMLKPKADIAGWTAYKKRLESIDPVALTQGELMARMGTVDEMKNALAIRGAADNMPSFKDTVVSGVYGAWAGSKGALGRIPIIGPAIAEATNEYYQAPERARAWAAAGGRKEYKQLQADAQRMGFYQKEMAPIAAGTQYQSMVAVGAFQAQADLARQTASEAVAKSRSQFEAMVVNSQNNKANAGVKVDSVEFRNFMTAGELTGLGRMEAADRVASVRQEAYLMQGNSMVVKRAVKLDDNGIVMKDAKGNAISALDANMQIQLDDKGNPIQFKVEEVNTVLTAQSLHKFRGDLTTKKFANNFDEMMIAHYGLAEKQYLRGNVDWDSTRDMNTSARAAATFARKDVNTDYLISGHLKMVEGKLKFKESEGQYNKLVEFRGDENRIKAEFIQQAMSMNGGMDGVLKAAAAAGKYDMSKEAGMVGAQIQTFRREALDKYATEVLKKSGTLLKMEAIFDESGAKGMTKYEEIAMIAPARDATRLSKLNESINKEYAKMFEVDTTFDGAAFKNTSIRNGGVTGQLDSLVTKLTEGVNSNKIPKEELGRAFGILTDAFKKVPDSSVTYTRNVEYNDNGTKREMVYTANGVTKEAYDTAKAEFAARGASSLWDLVSPMVFKKGVRLDKNNEEFYSTGSLGIDDEGAKRTDVDSSKLKVLPAKKGKNNSRASLNDANNEDGE